MAAEYLYASGLVIYLVNYTIGWLLYFKIISMNKSTHQVFYSLIIINIILLLVSLQFFSIRFFLVLASLIFMFILPIGKKGGVYHRIVSTAGILCYIIAN
jgi:hypothetical protein